MPRVLIVSPHFPPANTPDMQRVRMSLPHFVAAGWEIVVLTVDDREPLAPLEPELEATIPAPVRVVRVPALSRRWSRYLGMNNLGLRTLPQLYQRGAQLLRREAFDLVYFSTTQFIVFTLGRFWHLEFGVPYVIDLQDPWLSDYYHQPGAPPPPGGWKFHVSNALARLLEGWTLRRCTHVISVSERYLTTLRQRYPWFSPEQGSVLTFGAPDQDYVIARRLHASKPPLLPRSPTLKIAYAGRLGPDMRAALSNLFAGLARAQLPAPGLELFFFGTSYAPAGQATATTEALAAEHGIAALVHEHPPRIGYLDSLRLLLECDLTLVLGSEDRAYSPSKMYPTLLAGKPCLTIAPAGSVLEAKARELGGSALVTFAQADDPAAIAEVVRLVTAFAADPTRAPGPALDRDRLLGAYTAAAIAASQLTIFNRIIRAGALVQAELDPADYWPELKSDPPARP